MLIEYIPTFKYFSMFHTFTKDQKILDFGSNCGNFLKSNPNVIPLHHYTGIDVDIQAIEEGRKLFPESNWVWYNRKNPAYNPTGQAVLPNVDQNFDVVVSYSVFSHTSFEDTFELIEYLYSKINKGGKILFSYCDVENQLCVEWFRNRRVNPDQIPISDYVYLVENKVLYSEPIAACEFFVAFYRGSWLEEKLQKFNPKRNPAPAPWIQDCIILTKN